MTFARLGFMLLSLAWMAPRLPAGDSPPIAVPEKENSAPVPDATPTVKSTPAVSPPANPVLPPSGSGGSSEAKSPSIVRSALRDSFPYDPAVRAKSLVPASPDQAAQGTLDSDVVVLPKVEVTSRRFDRDLPAAIANWRPTGPQNHTKFGTGIRQKDFGKVRASVMTIFYIQVGVGLSW